MRCIRDLQKRWRSLSSVATLLFLLCGPARADGWLDVVVAGTRADNLTRAQDPADRRDDDAAALALSGGHYLAFSGQDGLSLTLDMRAEAYRRYRGLDVLGIGATAAYRRKLGLGTSVPWVGIALSGARDDYRDAIRDSVPLRLRAEVGQRFTDRLEGRVRVELDHRVGLHDPEPLVPGYSGRVFDLRGQGVHAALDFTATDALLLGAQFGVRRGQVESTARQSLAIFLASDAIAADPVFGEADFFAYRLRATTYTTVLTASWALSSKASLNVDYSDNRSRAAYDIRYVDRAITLSYAYRYP